MWSCQRIFAAIKGIKLGGTPDTITLRETIVPGVPVAQRGLEPRTTDVSDRHSNQPELLRIKLLRGKERTRTAGPSLFRGVLYRLSYRAMFGLGGRRLTAVAFPIVVSRNVSHGAAAEPAETYAVKDSNLRPEY